MTAPPGESGTGTRLNRADWPVWAGPLSLWAVALLLLPPGGDFPLNDDWIYGQAVLTWLQTGHYTGHPFTTASLFAQAGWGAAFCKLFGFSFVTLRWSTLVLWALAAATTGVLARIVGAGRWASALAGCLVIANPLAFNLGYTFMTDIPFMAFMALAGYGYLRALEGGRVRWLLWGSLFGVMALLTRQMAVVLPLAFLLALLPLRRRWRHRENGIRAVMFLSPWLVGLAVLATLPSDPAALGHVWLPQYLGENLAFQLLGGAKFVAAAGIYLGLFSLPLIADAFAHSVPWDRRTWLRALALVLTAAVAMGMAGMWPPRHLPYLGNVLYDAGLGPITIKGVYLETGERWTPHTWGDWWWPPTVLGAMGAAWMALAGLRWLRHSAPVSAPDLTRRTQQRFFMLWAAFAIIALYHPWLPVRFDRYLLGALVPVLVLVASAHGRELGSATGPVARTTTQALSLGLVVLLFAFSLAAQHDYLAWNRTRWNALSKLAGQGIPPEQIDGGYEFNGWYTSPHFIEEHGADAFIDSGPLGWWVVDDTYVIGWRTRPGYTILETIPYDTWLGPDVEILVLKRE